MRRNPLQSGREVISQDVVNPVCMDASLEALAKPTHSQGESMSISQNVVNPVANKMNSDSGPAVAYQTPLPARPVPNGK